MYGKKYSVRKRLFMETSEYIKLHHYFIQFNEYPLKDDKFLISSIVWKFSLSVPIKQ